MIGIELEITSLHRHVRCPVDPEALCDLGVSTNTFSHLKSPFMPTPVAAAARGLDIEERCGVLSVLS